MSKDLKKNIRAICERYEGDFTRLMDIFWDVQDMYHYVSEEALNVLSDELGLSCSELRDTLTFYHFFYSHHPGKIKIHLDTSIMSQLGGREGVLRSFESELGIREGEVDKTGEFGLFATPDIGLADQAPAALINYVPFTHLTPAKVKKIVAGLKKGKSPQELVEEYGDGANAGRSILSEVKNNVRKEGPVFFADWKKGAIVKKALTMAPKKIIEEVEESGLRGRGGAGFPTGKKWEFCRKAHADKKFIVCNADEGEPGTFKDRFILTEYSGLMIEGMIVAGHAIGSDAGIIYLRAEYRYLKAHLEKQIKDYRKKNLLGENILGSDFNFDIRIQMGAGAYVCGEESALIESLEGKRGEPRVRPPFPVESGYLSKPTSVNNCESFCAAARIVEHGAAWFKSFGTEASRGTKLLSVSGDVDSPGIYEVEWGQTIEEFLSMVGAKEPLAIQVGGPSGTLIAATDTKRIIGFEDLSTGGSMMVFGKDRNLFEIIHNFMDFFVDESCGCCLPCRAGNQVVRDIAVKFKNSEARPSDFEHTGSWSKIIADTSRCGLGQTSCRPVTTAMEAFPELFKANVDWQDNELFHPFDLEKASQEYHQTMREWERKS